MKIKFNYILIALVAIFATACHTYEGEKFDLQNYVTVSKANIDLPESVYDDGSKTRVGVADKLLIRRSTKDMSQPVDVFFTLKVTGKKKFEISATESVTIPAGEAIATIDLKSVDDEEDNGNTVIELELTSTSDASYTIGYPNWDKAATDTARISKIKADLDEVDDATAIKIKSGIFTKISVSEDDCDFVNADYSGVKDLIQEGKFGGPSQVTAELAADAASILIKDYLTAGLNIKVILDQVNKTAKLESTDYAAVFFFDPDGLGSINACSGQIKVPITITKKGGAPEKAVFILYK